MRDEQELENMLLEVAGRPKGSEGKQPAKRRVLPPQESSSDDDDDDYHDYDGNSRYEDDGGNGRKGKGLKVPLKKRFDVDKDDEDREDGSQSDLSYGSDLYKDEEDRRVLEGMTELQREMILHDRAEQRENLLKKIRPSGSSLAQRDRNEGPPSSRMRSSVREPARSVKADALNALVARRQRAQDTDIRRRQESKGSREPEPSSSEEESEGESSSSRSRSRSREDKEDDEDNDDEVSKDEAGRSDGEGAASEDEERETDDEDNNLIRSITIRRSKLFKWFMEPFFEDVIRGCFVRIGIGTSSSGLSIYRLCLVKNVDAKEPEKLYKFENRMTYKYLNCTWGDDSTAARWQMTRISDQPPTDDEIKAWKRACSGRGITTAEILEKQEALSKANSFVYSAATVKQMLQEKKQAAARPSNIALEKDRLLKELALAESKGEQGEVERLQEKIRELEAYSMQHSLKNTKAERIEMMNRKNRIENFKNASELKPINPHAKAGEAGYDPFSRRWTRSQNYYKSDSSNAVKEGDEGKPEKEKAAEEVGVASKAGEKSTMLGNMHTLAEKGAKIFNLHDFDLPISLDFIEQLGGAQGAPLAFMERKRKLEARYGVRVENNDGRRHSLTLTVNDYKRRRGLL
ncbi:hypothetical protein O6H91_13G074900 [Diphasiastrum complanatum]|uniref:Uncharacterized protein n=1 Tax=Diphasiastrum complanatum TaxID=34168 RepID=A0ACC2BW37_DIPCM|nr:hypothetical protein O6H91_13G074900 [Diphasiastrum complanatum]